MADINVERRGPKVWPWIIGLIILVLLIWAIAEIMDRNGEPTREVIEVVPQPGTTTPAPGEVPGTSR